MSLISVKVFRFVVHGAAARGVQAEVLLAAAGLAPERLADPDLRLPLHSARRLWHEAARLTGDEDFGLHLSELLQVGDFGGLGFAARSSATVGEAYQRVVRYLRVLVQSTSLALETDGPHARIRHVWPDPAEPLSRHQVEFLMGCLLQVGRLGSETEFLPHEVRFSHPAPPRLDELHRVFGPRLRFGAAADELVLDQALLALPQRQAEPALAAVLDRHLQDVVSGLPQDEPPTLLERVRGALASELGHGEPNLLAVARRLHMSPRSLQRRLQLEGHSLQGVLAALRSDLAIRYLSERDESVSEIAFLLGFSEVSTFHRAFKRWTGVTPAAYRAARGRQPGL